MIGKRINLAVVLSITVFAITGCSSLNVGGKTYEIVGEANDLTPAEEEYIRRNGAMSSIQQNVSVSALGAPIQQETNPPSEKQKELFLITKNESLYSVISRLIQRDNYTRFIFDLSQESAAPDRIKASRKLKIKGDKDALIPIENLFQRENEYLRVFTAADNGGQALVVSDKPYPSWLSKRVHIVKKGTLLQASEDIAQAIGWTLGPEKGYQAQNFNINNSYPLIITPKDAKISFTALLNQYPARALLNPNTQTATIVTRIQPKTN